MGKVSLNVCDKWFVNSREMLMEIKDYLYLFEINNGVFIFQYLRVRSVFILMLYGDKIVVKKI